MEIIDSRNIVHTIQDIASGDVFIYQDHVYIKVASERCSAVNLTTGKLVVWDDLRDVQLVHAKLVIE